MSDTAKLIAVGLIFLAALVYGVFLIIWANECAAHGGAYLIPQNGFPVCLAGVK